MTSQRILAITQDAALRERLNRLLEEFAKRFDVTFAENRTEAEQALFSENPDEPALALALVDDTLPDVDEASFLVRLHREPRTRWAYKVLILKDPDVDILLKAVNHGGLDFCFSGEWEDSVFVETVRGLLTEYILDHRTLSTDDKMSYGEVLESERFLHFIHSSALTSWSNR
jgi:CheY-like chemotaxis protein